MEETNKAEKPEEQNKTEEQTKAEEAKVEQATTRIKKGSVANTGKFSYRYTDLSTIHEELERQGITYRQYIKYFPDAEADYIFTVLKHGDEEELPPLQGCRVVQTVGDGRMSAAQAQGSALTYARRYSLLMALGWATEDDDGASAGEGSNAETQNSGRLDFDVLKAELAELNTLDELRTHYAQTAMKFKMTDKQRHAVTNIYSKRKEELGIQE